VTVLFSDLEGRLHMLDYDKKFLIKSWDNLTLTAPRSVDLPRNAKATCGWPWIGGRLLGASDVFGSGKVLFSAT